ncbi:unnamed protein product [Phytophthora fragariaefolia]|uniref:Unnamed protein product n=1 Tax=Phytophthora fragariaefolia TaxID=1490495 RepID=A0A9W6TRP2_9STRA|nr:unnamed protein product [Phytophthora fragariaefolia]
MGPRSPTLEAEVTACSLAGSGSPPSSPVSPTVVMQPLRLVTSVSASAAAKPSAPSKNPPSARSPACSVKRKPKYKSTSNAKSVDPDRSAKDASKPKSGIKAEPAAPVSAGGVESKPKSASKPSAGKAKLATSDVKARTKSDGGVPPHHIDVKVLLGRAAVSARLVSSESGPMKRLRDLPFSTSVQALLGEDSEFLRCFGDHGEDCRW